MLYRDAIQLGDEGRPLPANVTVVSARETVKNTGAWGTRSITVSTPPSLTDDIAGATILYWRGDRYNVVDTAIPIVALGRLDHYEINAERVTPA